MTSRSRLYDAWKISGISQKDLAAEIGTSSQYLWQMLNDRRPVPPATAVALGAALGIDPGEISDSFSDVADTLEEHGLLPAGQMAKPKRTSLPSGIQVKRLDGFDYDNFGQSLISLPAALLGEISPRINVSTRWIIAPTDSLAPEINKDDLVLIDIKHTDLDEISGVGIYALHFLGQPDIKRIQRIDTNEWRLRGFGKDSDSIDIKGERKANVKIAGLAFAWFNRKYVR